MGGLGELVRACAAAAPVLRTGMRALQGSPGSYAGLVRVLHDLAGGR